MSLFLMSYMNELLKPISPFWELPRAARVLFSSYNHLIFPSTLLSSPTLLKLFADIGCHSIFWGTE